MNDREVDDRFNAAQMIAREAGALALQYFSRSVGLEVRIKGPQDIVSNADHDVEKLIRNRIEDCSQGMDSSVRKAAQQQSTATFQAFG